MLTSNPSPAEIRAARIAAGLTQAEAGAIVGYSRRGWQSWEVDVDSPEHRPMRAGVLDQFKALTGLA